jgi:glycosyltransferase involved in cell wall biosynthesis
MAERGSVLRKGFLLLWGRSLGLPTVLHLHAAEMVPFYNRLSAPSKKVVQFIFRSAGVCIVLGHGCGHWLNTVLGVAQDRIEVLANGVPAPAKRPSPAAESNFNMLFLGNLQARKGLGDLLSALSQQPLAGRNWALIVAGGGNAVPFQRQAKQLGLAERVRFTGWLDRDACSGLLAQTGLLVLPSYHEGLPLVLLEAASLGIPSVTTPVGAIPEVFVDKETASFVPPGDVTALSTAILQMIDDRGLRRRIGENARSLYEASLSIETFAKGLLAIYARHCSGISGNAPSRAIRVA